MLIKDLLNVLTLEEKREFLLIFTLILITGFIDTLGIASIMPLVAILTNPELISENLIISYIFEKSALLGIQNEREFKIAMIWTVLIILIVSISIKTIATYTQLRFAMTLEHTISSRLLNGYLHASYNWFRNNNTARIGNKILSEVSNVVIKGFIPLMTIISQIILTLFIVILLMMVEIKIAMAVGAVLVSVYALIMYGTRSKLEALSKSRLEENENRFKYVAEGFKDIKYMKINHAEEWHYKRFKEAAKKYAQYSSQANLISVLPRYIIEGIAFSGVLILMLIITTQGNDLVSILPLLTLYLFAGYRLIPAIQQIYGGLTHLRFA